MDRSRRVRLTAGLSAIAASVLTMTTLTACGPSATGGGGSDPSKAASSSGPAASGVPKALTVKAPGPFDGTQYGDDLLLVSQDTIPAKDLKAILALKVGAKKGIAASSTLSFGQFSQENKVFNLAAVDAASFRAFTGPRSAGFQEQWDRIAGGEVAVADGLQDQLPIDDKGFLTVGKQSIHVGAWSPSQVDGIDAMVNTKWGKEIGLPADNAILLNTGIASPQAVREQIEKTFGKERFSITALDIVAQRGLDLDTFQNVIPIGAYRDAIGVFRYRPTGGGRIAPDPAWVKAYIVTETVPILGRVTCNKHMMPQLKAALAEVVTSKLASKINPKQYAGCYYPRFIAGSNKLSNHSFGLALDFNVAGNQRGTVGEMDRAVVAIFKRWGFAWGGDWSWTDPMHFELARIVSPG